MLNVSVTKEAADKLRVLLEEEGEDACVRVRETKVGSACKSKFVLKLSIDEGGDDDLEGQAESLLFVADRDLVDQYGKGFSVTLDEHQMPTVAALSCGCACDSAKA